MCWLLIINNSNCCNEFNMLVNKIAEVPTVVTAVDTQ